MFLSFGTSAWIAGTSGEVNLDREKTLIGFGHVVPGKYMPCGTMQAAGSSYSYIKEALCAEEVRQAEETGESVYELLNRLVLQSPPGAKGLIFLPYLLGEKPQVEPGYVRQFSGHPDGT